MQAPKARAARGAQALKPERVAVKGGGTRETSGYGRSAGLCCSCCGAGAGGGTHLPAPIPPGRTPQRVGVTQGCRARAGPEDQAEAPAGALTRWWRPQTGTRYGQRRHLCGGRAGKRQVL